MTCIRTVASVLTKIIFIPHQHDGAAGRATLLWRDYVTLQPGCTSTINEALLLGPRVWTSRHVTCGEKEEYVSDLQKLLSSPVNMKWRSPENCYHFLCKISAGENINAKPLAKWTMAIRISQVLSTKRSVKTLWIWHLNRMSPELGTRSLAMWMSALTRRHTTRHVMF